MPTYKFKIGETAFVETHRNSNFPGGAYVVTQKMPERNGKFEYRVRSSHEPHASAAMGHFRPINDVCAMSAFHPIATELLHDGK